MRTLTSFILDQLPAETTAGERLLLVAALLDVRWLDEPVPVTRALLRQRTGLSADAQTAAWNRLAARGLEARELIGHNSAGRPVYARTGPKGSALLVRLPPPLYELALDIVRQEDDAAPSDGDR